MAYRTRPALQCHEIEDDLALMALGLLRGHEQTVVVEHIQHCSSCRSELQGLVLVARALRRFRSSIHPRSNELRDAWYPVSSS